jgi:hypothetical protein
MQNIVRFPSSTEIPIKYSAVGVSNTETDAIVVKPIDKNPTSIAEIGGNTQATLYIDFTKDTLTKVQIRVYGSYLGNPTANDWFQETVETDSVGVATLDKFVIELSASARIAYHIAIGAYQAFKITVQSVGTVGSSAITLNLGLRTN